MEGLTNSESLDGAMFEGMENDGLKAMAMSFTVIMLSEIGDKTFFIAAILAMSHPRLLVFAAAISALAVMTVLSAFLGHLAPMLISKSVTQIGAALLFLVFGVRMLRDGWTMTGKECQQELKEVAAELDEKESAGKAEDMEGGGKRGLGVGQTVGGPAAMARRGMQAFGGCMRRVTSPVFVEGFVLTFLAEWGDRSQIATVALAGAEDFWWVSVGSLCGHAICSAVAVIGGRMLASRISVKTITLAGGALFILFGILAFNEATDLKERVRSGVGSRFATSR
ncbi:hypothetical protein DFS34DRAFT_619911 [Phlyctochytrium arcticum]|nr:hypothetical protein DFS34DRAFT_619911 [Phlyctochytrium arcticum]